jgi:hypothetical protein
MIGVPPSPPDIWEEVILFLLDARGDPLYNIPNKGVICKLFSAKDLTAI